MRKRILAAAVLVIVVFIGATAYSRTTERARLSIDLQRAGIVPDASGSLPALRMQWFIAIQRIDPIFAIEGTDPMQLRQALSVLYQKEGEFTRSYTDSERAALSALYPKDFLNALPETETRRLELLAHPSVRNAIQYQEQLSDTIDAYVSDAHELSARLRASTSTGATYAFVGQTTNIDSFAQALSDLAHSARQQYAKASRRFGCLSFYSLGCESISELLRARADSIIIPPSSAAPDASALAIDALLGTIHAQMRTSYSDRPLPPLIAEQSRCYTYPTTYIRAWWETLPEGGDARKASVANDIYLNNIHPEQNAVYAEAYAQGARYKYQVSGHYYLCVDSGIEVARTDGALRVYSMLRERSIFGPADGPDRDLAAQEENIRDATYIDQRAIAQYVHDAAMRIATRGYAPLLQQIGPEELDRLELMIALYRQGAAQFDEVIREAAFESEYMSLFQKEPRIPVFALLFTRSYASVLFFAGNQTFSPHSPSFAYEQKVHPLILFRMSSYNELLRSGSSSAEIVGAVLRMARIERSLLP